MRSHARFGPLMISLGGGGLLSGCFSSTKEVETVPAPVVQAPPPVVQVPPPVVVAPNPNASQTTNLNQLGAMERHPLIRQTQQDSKPQHFLQWSCA
jgi:hypothetical protein